MAFTPTLEQAAIVEAARKTKDNLLVSALAGATKTSTLVLVAQAVLTPTLAVSFNKKIADEMSKRLPGHVMSATLNSVGHRAWGAALGKRMAVDANKGYNGLKEYADSRPAHVKRALQDNFASIMRAVRLGKSLGYVPEKARSMGKSLCHEGQFEDALWSTVDCDIDDAFLSAVDEMLLRSIAEAYQGLIDFDDQIYMSTLFGGQFTKYPLVLIDETQDLSPLNFEMLTRLVGQRLIAVGDQNQAIYAFRGAHSSAMSVMKEKFSMTELPLTVSMRCPIKVVELVRNRVPQMQYPEWAKEGHVERLTELDPKDIPDGAAIICRNNAPLFAAALRLIRAGRGVHILGNDIGAGLVKLMKKIAPTVLEKEEFRKAINRWRSEEIAKQPEERHALINDKHACLMVFCDVGKDSNEAMIWAENLFKQAGSIQMMTGHKSKGLEFDIVYHLEPHLVPSKWARKAAEEGDDSKLQQELNLKYVIETRAKDKLFMVDLQDIE
jgi:DNA helicase-2/ATP-dependent DNA helicase PcrA